MPRTASFDLSEVKTSSPKGTQPKYRSNTNFHEVSKNVPQQPKQKEEKCCRCSCGWYVGLFMSACSLTFLVLLGLFPDQFVPQFIIIKRERHLLVQKGYLRVYPNLPQRNVGPNDRVPGVYVINPSSEYIETEIVPSIEEILTNYTDVKDDKYPPNPYVLCWLEKPLQAGKPCYFDKNWILKSCTKENHYGYKSNQGLYNPCILLRIEEAENWAPQVFRDVNRAWVHQYDASHFAVNCYPSVKQPRMGRQLQMKVYPNKGFPVDFFPQSSFEEELYLPPMVMVQFLNLEVGKNFSIDCWIQARNSWFLKDSGVIQIHFRHESNKELISKEMWYLEDDTDNTTEEQSLLKNNSTLFDVHRFQQN